MNVSCALDPRSVSPLWCLLAYRNWAAQTSSSSTRTLRSMALTTAKTATPRDARGISGIFFVFQQDIWLSARVRDKLTCRGTTAATRVPRWRIGERPREVAQEGSTG